MTEFAILDFIQEHLRTPVGDMLMPLITRLGNGGFLWILTGLILLVQKKHRKAGILVLASLAMEILFCNVYLKNAVAAPRPCDLNPSVALLIPKPSDYSFPSGHSLIGFAGAVSIWRMHPRMGSWFLALAGLIAFSRLYLFVHFPTDVLAGAAIGTALAFLVTDLAKGASEHPGIMSRKGRRLR